ncbi:MAG: sulfatase [Candidatus Sumerlaeia bacterium]|nr:sulfatase [Candidatus Sumerlaeia bacterium]
MSTLSRRRFLNRSAIGTAVFAAGPVILTRAGLSASSRTRRPNILFCISDDQSFAHTGATGCKTVNTPNFDRVAREGVLFTQAFVAAPQCSPNRASILTGRHIWQNREAGTHASNFPRDLTVYPDLLEKAGYFVGCSGKAWGPGNYQITGWPRNPAGPSFSKGKKEPPAKGIAADDFRASFKDFLAQKPKDSPFCFWMGCKEPHRDYQKGIGVKSGKRLADVVVPPFLPDVEEVRNDILDYCFEIDWFDRHVGEMLQVLEETGELDNTIVVVTSDNGMPFPNAKANLREYGLRMPLAIRWGAGAKGGRVVDDLISFVDFAPTFLEAAGVAVPESMSGRSFLNVLQSDKSGRVDAARDKAFSGRERHTHARPDNVGYPARSIRTHDFLFVLNLKPDRWPVGDPEGFHDTDDGPTKTWMIKHRNDPNVKELYQAAFEKRPAEELFDIRNDPGCLRNLANQPEFAGVKKKLRAELERTLAEQKDPRMAGDEVFDSYPRYSPMRPQLGGFAEEGQYNPKFQAKK